MISDKIPEILNKTKEYVFDKLKLDLVNLVEEKEGQIYLSYRFELNQSKVIFRNAKITPSKVGQFVTLWKRNDKGVTQPFDFSDDFDFIIINTQYKNHWGHFVFSKLALKEHSIISFETKEGKRGIRVYPPWDKVTNKQAERTQKWQLEYFLEIPGNEPLNMELANKFYS
jgi:hypothetical protein